MAVAMDPVISNAPQWIEFVQWGFYAMITGCAILAVQNLKEMKNSIIDLTKSMAQVIERQSWQEKEIDRLDVRVDRLEKP